MTPENGRPRLPIRKYRCVSAELRATPCFTLEEAWVAPGCRVMLSLRVSLNRKL